MSQVVELREHEHKHEPLLVVVETNTPTGGPHNVYLVDYSETTVKRWIVRTTVWCVKNGNNIKIRSPTQEETDAMRVFRPELVKRRNAA